MAVTDTIDWELSLKLSNNKAELAKELLLMLVADLPGYEADIRIAHTQHNTAELLDHLHKLHGACCYCGVPALRTLVKDAEAEIKREKQVPSHEVMQLLYQQIDDVIEQSNQYVQD